MLLPLEFKIPIPPSQPHKAIRSPMRQFIDCLYYQQHVDLRCSALQSIYLGFENYEKTFSLTFRITIRRSILTPLVLGQWVPETSAEQPSPLGASGRYAGRPSMQHGHGLLFLPCYTPSPGGSCEAPWTSWKPLTPGALRRDRRLPFGIRPTPVYLQTQDYRIDLYAFSAYLSGSSVWLPLSTSRYAKLFKARALFG